jgi:hypothetical protein
VSSGIDVYRGALAAVERIANRGGTNEDVLRGVLAILSRLDRWGRVAFVLADGRELAEQGSVANPPSARGSSRGVSVPIVFAGTTVGELVAAAPRGEAAVGAITAGDCAFLQRVAVLASPYCRPERGGERRSGAR